MFLRSLRPIYRQSLLRTVSFKSNTFHRKFSDQVEHYLPKDEVEARVLEVLKSYDKIDNDKVTNQSIFQDDLGLDSLDTVEVVMAFEDEFDIEIADENAEKILSVTDAIDYITKHPFAK